MTRIDFHAHAFPKALTAVLPPGFPAPPPLGALAESMERRGIDAAILSAGLPGGPGPDAGLARAVNEQLAEIVRDAPGRFGALAMLPLPDVDAALAELDRALGELGLDGVLLMTNVGGTYPGDPAWEPLFEELDRRGAYVFLHPSMPPHPVPLAHPPWLYEFPFDTTRALAQLVYSGTLERHPRVRLQAAHLGGAAPFLSGRLASLAEREPQLAGDAPAGALEYLRRLYYDTALSNNLPALAATREAVGLERVVFGTDWPYGVLPDGDPAPALDALGAEARAAIEHRNAAALVPRLAAADGPA